MIDITAGWLLHLLADIEAALPALSAQPATREVGSQVASGAAFASRPPGDLSVLELVWWSSNQAVLPKLISWAVMIAEERRDAGFDDAGPVDGELPAVCAYLRQRVGFVVTQAWVDELEMEWSDMRAQLRQAPGSPLYREVIERTRCTATVHDVVGGRSCPGMVETRVRDHGRGTEVTSRCRTCGTVYTDKAMVAAMNEQDELSTPRFRTAAECVAQLAVHGMAVGLRQIEYWAGRGDLTRGPKIGRERTYIVEQVARRARRDLRRAVHADALDGAACRSLGNAPTDAP